MRFGAATIFLLLRLAVADGEDDVSVKGAAKVSNSTRSRQNVELFVIDTDAGVDDAMAILYVLGAEKLQGKLRVIGITCVNGNTKVDNVVVNVLKTLKTADRLGIPVYRGAQEALLFTPKVDDYFGSDGFGDFEFEDPPPLSLVKDKLAANALVQAVKKRPGAVSVLCLGPLTNIALAVRLYPEFLRDVKNLYVLGSSVEGVGNIRPGVEFNFHVDPEAVYIVLKSAEKFNKTVTLMPWETVSIRGKTTMKWRMETLGAVASPAMRLINRAENKSLSYYEGNVWYQGDPMIAAVAVNNAIVKSSTASSVIIETCGAHGRGVVLVDPSPNPETSNVRIVREIHMSSYKNSLLKFLNA